MKILMVTPMPPQAHAPGAIPAVLHAQLAGLAARHEITLVTVAGLEPGEWEAVEQLRSSGIPVHAVRRQEPRSLQRWKRRWRLGSAWLRGEWPWRTIWFWEPEIQRILDTLLAEQSFDLVAVEDNAMGAYRYRTRVPVILTEHEVRRPRPFDWRSILQSREIGRLVAEVDWQRWRRYQKETWEPCARIQVFTPRDADAIQAIAPELADRLRVNAFGIDLPARSRFECEDQESLLFVGNFTHQPNVDAALWLGQEIMPRVWARLPGARLDLVGIYPPQAVQALAGERIRVLGVVPRVEPYLERCSVVLAPVRIGGGMRMKVLQAMAHGKTVITTPRGADGLLADGGRPPLVIAEHAEAMAEAVEQLLDCPDDRRALGNRAREYVEKHYSAQAYARRLEAVYSEVLC